MSTNMTSQQLTTSAVKRLINSLFATSRELQAQLEAGKEVFQSQTQLEQRAFEMARRELDEAEQILANEQHEHESQDLAALVSSYDAEEKRLRTEYTKLQESARRQHDEALEAAAKERDESCWMVESVLDDTSPESPSQRLAVLCNQMESADVEIQSHLEAIAPLPEILQKHLDRCGMHFDLAPERVNYPENFRDSLEQIGQHSQQAQTLAKDILRRPLGYLLRGKWSLLFWLFTTVAFYLTVVTAVDPRQISSELNARDLPWHAIAAGAGAVAAFVLWLLIRAVGRSDLSHLLDRFLTEVNSSRELAAYWKKHAATELSRKEREFDLAQQQRSQKRQTVIELARAKYSQKEAEQQSALNNALRQLDLKYPPGLKKLTDEFQLQKSKAQQSHLARQQETTQSFLEQRQFLERAHHQKTTQLATDWQSLQDQISATWVDLCQSWHNTCQLWRLEISSHSPPWSQLAHSSPSAVIPKAIPVGTYSLRDGLVAGWPASANQSQLSPVATLPACLTLQEAPSLVIRYAPGLRESAAAIMQQVMLRWLTSLPPGKSRFTIFDPVGLGASFAPFMHLADIDEKLIGNRIWTESGHIEQRLAQLTEHMENVFQTYLRNEYASIEEYNA